LLLAFIDPCDSFGDEKSKNEASLDRELLKIASLNQFKKGNGIEKLINIFIAMNKEERIKLLISKCFCPYVMDEKEFPIKALNMIDLLEKELFSLFSQLYNTGLKFGLVFYLYLFLFYFFFFLEKKR
jgi:hypothetical protein